MPNEWLCYIRSLLLSWQPLLHTGSFADHWFAVEPSCGFVCPATGYGSLSDSRAYLPERPDKELYDDLAWYEGRYPSQLGGRNEEATGRSRAAAAAARMSARTAAAAASDTGETCSSSKPWATLHLQSHQQCMAVRMDEPSD